MCHLFQRLFHIDPYCREWLLLEVLLRYAKPLCPNKWIRILTGSAVDAPAGECRFPVLGGLNPVSLQRVIHIDIERGESSIVRMISQKGGYFPRVSLSGRVVLEVP